MVAVVRKLLALLIPLIAVPLAFAQNLISIQLVGKVFTASFDYVYNNGLVLTANLYYNGDLNNVAGGYLKIYVFYYGDGKIVYQDVIPVNVQNYVQMQYYIPGSVFPVEGKYIVKFIYQVATKDRNTVESEDGFTVLVSNIVNNPIRITKIYPDLTNNEILYFDRGVTNFMVEVYNPGDNSQYVTVRVDLLDNQGNLVLSQSQSSLVLPVQRKSITVPVNFLAVQPGKYKLVLVVFRGIAEEVRYEREVVIGEDQYIPAYIYSVNQHPYEVKPGDFVEFRVLVKNKGEPTQVKLIVNSTSLNLYKETSTFELDANEAKEIKLVVRVPENLSTGRYPVQFTLQRGTAGYKYVYYLGVKGVEKTGADAVRVELIKPSELTVGNYSEFRLVVWSNVEELMTYHLRVKAEGAEVSYNDTFTIGGVGEKIELPIKVKPTSNRVLLNVTLYDENGNVVYSSTEELRANVVIDLRYYLMLALLAVVLVILVALLVYLIRGKLGKGKKKRKVEEA